MIESFLKLNPGFTILIAPPAWGKTQLLKKVFRDQGRFLFVSPLRALANEFSSNLLDEFTVLNIEKMSDWKKNDSQKIVITTPELLKDSSMIDDQFTLIFDEFHLYFYWGMSFREEMWRALVDLCSLNRKIIGLTATLSNENLKTMQEQFVAYEYQVTILNLGNQKLKNTPQEICYLPMGAKNSWTYFLQESENCVLIFCQYRKQVLELENKLQKNGLRVISCIGGGASEFSVKLKKIPCPQFILSTTVLSHGVNLPVIEQIIFTYPVKNFDFWIQMVGRGGRRGEKYKVITYDHFFANRWLKLISFFTLLKAYIRYHFVWDTLE